jgi:hypothetical protein
METKVFQIEINNGSTYRVFCANKSQINRAVKSYNKISGLCKKMTTITNGLHTVEKWEKIVSSMQPIVLRPLSREDNLSMQLKALTGDGYNAIDWENLDRPDLVVSARINNVLRHKKTGLTVKLQ